jgi:hypothetical protein
MPKLRVRVWSKLMKELVQQLESLLSERRELMNKIIQLEMRQEEVMIDILNDVYESLNKLTQPKPKRDFKTSVIDSINEQVRKNPEVEKTLEELGFKSW